jgi:hypothetical protein
MSCRRFSLFAFLLFQSPSFPAATFPASKSLPRPLLPFQTAAVSPIVPLAPNPSFRSQMSFLCLSSPPEWNPFTPRCGCSSPITYLQSRRAASQAASVFSIFRNTPLAVLPRQACKTAFLTAVARHGISPPNGAQCLTQQGHANGIPDLAGHRNSTPNDTHCLGHKMALQQGVGICCLTVLTLLSQQACKRHSRPSGKVWEFTARLSLLSLNRGMKQRSKTQ